MLRSALTGLTAAAGAVLSSQFPAYYAHYLQRLGGRLDQARIQVERLEAAARAEGLGLDEYVDVFLASEQSAHRRQGGVMLAEIADLEHLRAAFDSLVFAVPLERPFHFARHLDGELARATLSNFEPGLPLTQEGLIYAAAGFVLGLLTVGAARRMVRVAFRRRQAA